MNYKKIKRKAEDYCNICGKMAQLTWDHVPPKCCNNKYNVKTNAWFEGLPEENKYHLQYQNGIRYRSLCSKCNNDILGINYDTVLAEFTEEMMHILQTERNCLAEFVMPIQINRLSRAICGHLLAAKNYYEDNCIIDDWLREYVLNPNTLPPNEMRLLYWIYPYSTIFVIRDVNILPNCSQFAFPKGTISAINCFPVSYLLTSEKKTRVVWLICLNMVQKISMM